MHIEIPKLRERQRREREELVVQEAERLNRGRGVRQSRDGSRGRPRGRGHGHAVPDLSAKEDLFAAVVVRRMERFTAQLVATCQCSDLSLPMRLVLVSHCAGCSKYIPRTRTRPNYIQKRRSYPVLPWLW